MTMSESSAPAVAKARPGSTAVTPLVRATIRHLAERRLPASPDHYLKAWLAVGGRAPAGMDVADAADVAQALRAVLDAFEHRHRDWTHARKRQSLDRILDAARGDPRALIERLDRLIRGWKLSPLSGEPSPCPADGATAPAVAPGAVRASETGRSSSGADGDAADECPVIGSEREEILAWRLWTGEQSLHDIADLTAVLCDSLEAQCEDSGWVAGQLRAVRDTLRGDLDRRSIAQARALLLQTADVQHEIARRRVESIATIRDTLRDWVGMLGELGESTARYGDRIGAHAETIRGSSSMEALAGTVEVLVADTRALQRQIKDRADALVLAQDRARALQGEVAQLEDRLAQYGEQLLTDHLTNSRNRRGLEQSFEEAMRRAVEFAEPLSLGLIDVDDFKRLNDELGHEAGDRALRHIADVIKGKLRPHDTVARYGGEEFVLLLPGTPGEKAAAVVSRLQREMTKQVFLHESRQTFITFSGGVTTVLPGEVLGAAIARADEAMYQAKRAGKNCVRRA